MKAFNQKPLNEKAAIICGILLLAFVIWALIVGDINGFNNTYLH